MGEVLQGTLPRSVFGVTSDALAVHAAILPSALTAGMLVRDLTIVRHLPTKLEPQNFILYPRDMLNLLQNKKYFLIAAIVISFGSARLWMPTVHRWLGETYSDEAWDQKVKQLCAMDGGLKVFEIAQISPALFKALAGNKDELVFPLNSNDAPFFTETTTTVLYQQKHLKQGNFEGIQRTETKYIQRDENKTLAVNVHYMNLGVHKVDERPAFFGQCALPQQNLTKHFIQVK